MSPDEMEAWDKYFAAAVIAETSKPNPAKGSPMEGLHDTTIAICNRAAAIADQMMKLRKERYKRT